MKRLIHKNRTPHGGTYRLDKPELGLVGSGSTFKQLEKDVLSYRISNGIPSGLGFSQELEEAVCDCYPNECNNNNPSVLQKPHRLSFGDVVQGTRVMASYIAISIAEGKKPIVSMEEATRRSEICLNCKQHVYFAKPCSGNCGELRAMVKRLVGPQSVPRASELNSCFICHCFLESAVWMRLDIQLKPLSDGQRAQFEQVPNCWKKPSLLQQ